MIDPSTDSHAESQRLILTPDQRLRVFISSTLQELADERLAAREAITGLRLTPILFELGARPHPPRELYRAYLEQSHIFVGIYWQSYGWVAPDMNISGLEDEYQLSGERPKLIYFKEPAPDRQPRLRDLLKKIQSDNNVSYRHFVTADELRELIRDDLALLLTEHFETARSGAPTVTKIPEGETINLPTPRTPLVGREAEVAEISELLLRPEVRLVTLNGTGGIGKTRLAIEVGQQLKEQFSGGLGFVPLATVTDPELVIPTIAKTLGLRESSVQTLETSLGEYLRNRKFLLILDNFEQVISAADQVAELLNQSPGLKILVTSRSVLNVYGEHLFFVPPLKIPSGKQLKAIESGDLSSLSTYPAISLFVQAAQRVKPNFFIDRENWQAIVEICRHLDGLPLAIELAAARIKLFTPQAMHARLEGSLQWLTSGPRDLPERQQTLRGAIEWSYSLLDEAEKRLFSRLSAFVGGCNLEAIEAVGSWPGAPDVVQVLISLVDKSLVRQTEDSENGMRFSMLAIIWEFAREKLEASQDADEVLCKHADYFLELAEIAGPELKGRRGSYWFDRLETEYDNLRALVRWSLEHGEEERVARMSWALWYYWWNRGYHSEASRWIEQILQKEDRLPAAILAHARFAGGFLCYVQGYYAETLPYKDQMLDMMREAGDQAGEALAHVAYGMVYMHLNDAQAAANHFERGLSLYQSLEDTWGIAFALISMGELALSQGEWEKASNLFSESMTLFWEAGDKSAIVWSQFFLAISLLFQNDPEWANSLLQSGLTLASQLKAKQNLAHCLEGLAGVAAVQGRMERSACLWGAADGLRKATGHPASPTEKALYQPFIARVRSILDPGTFSASWKEGADMSLDQAIAFATEI